MDSFLPPPLPPSFCTHVICIKLSKGPTTGTGPMCGTQQCERPSLRLPEASKLPLEKREEGGSFKVAAAFPTCPLTGKVSLQLSSSLLGICLKFHWKKGFRRLKYVKKEAKPRMLNSVVLLHQRRGEVREAPRPTQGLMAQWVPAQARSQVCSLPRPGPPSQRAARLQAWGLPQRGCCSQWDRLRP